MIEIVARAIFEKCYQGEVLNLIRGTPPAPWEMMAEPVRAMFLEQARAAIEAMKNPTPEMIEEGGLIFMRERENGGADIAAGKVFEAMLDAALK